MQNPKNQSRRQFIKSLALTAAAVPAAMLIKGSPLTVKSVFAAGADALPEGKTPVSESDPVASAIGYKANVKDIDYTKYPQRKKKEASKQFCSNCALYTKANDGWGSCSMLTSGVVSAKGWCGSYSKKG